MELGLEPRQPGLRACVVSIIPRCLCEACLFVETCACGSVHACIHRCVWVYGCSRMCAGPFCGPVGESVQCFRGWVALPARVSSPLQAWGRGLRNRLGGPARTSGHRGEQGRPASWPTSSDETSPFSICRWMPLG